MAKIIQLTDNQPLKFFLAVKQEKPVAVKGSRPGLFF